MPDVKGEPIESARGGRAHADGKSETLHSLGLGYTGRCSWREPRVLAVGRMNKRCDVREE